MLVELQQLELAQISMPIIMGFLSWRQVMSLLKAIPHLTLLPSVKFPVPVAVLAVVLVRAVMVVMVVLVVLVVQVVQVVLVAQTTAIY
jgi:hypothetical protein